MDDNNNAVTLGDKPMSRTAQIAHGIVISLVVVIWFPLGVFLLRLLKHPRTVRFHSIWQTVGLILLLIGFGLGAWLNNITGGSFKQGHILLGVVVVLAFLLMPVFGWLHHRSFVKTGTKGWTSYVHVWMGRAVIVLGIINGLTGLQLADNTKGGWVVYGVVAALFVIAYLAVLWKWKRGEKTAREEVELS